MAVYLALHCTHGHASALHVTACPESALQTLHPPTDHKEPAESSVSRGSFLEQVACQAQGQEHNRPLVVYLSRNIPARTLSFPCTSCTSISDPNSHHPGTTTTHELQPPMESATRQRPGCTPAPEQASLHTFASLHDLTVISAIQSLQPLTRSGTRQCPGCESAPQHRLCCFGLCPSQLQYRRLSSLKPLTRSGTRQRPGCTSARRCLRTQCPALPGRGGRIFPWLRQTTAAVQQGRFMTN